MLAILASLLSLSLPSSNFLWRKMRDIEKDGKHILRTAQGYHRTHIPLGCPHTCSLLLLLSHFSHVQLCATPETAAHQAPPSLGFSRPEHWSGLPFPSPVHESEKWKWSRSVVSDSERSDPIDCSPPGSSIQGIFQARVLEWGAIAFSDNPLVGLTI